MRQVRTAGWLICLFGALVMAAWLPLAAQITTADLSGRVFDPKGLVVPAARLRVENLATGLSRQTLTDTGGNYSFLGLPPGNYRLSVVAKGFATLVNSSITLTIGEKASYNASLRIAAQAQTVTVTGGAALVETTRTGTATTILGRQITDLPINGRDYINFTMLTSAARRDDTPSIGAAPTSGLNFNGQRGRSNDVLIDGADAVDASVGGIRSTVSQEAVQEFQVLENNFMPEFGHAMGGVVNIVTKSGSNQFHGDVFGYFRNKNIQARNPFSVQVDPATGQAVGVKQPYTRVQAGATVGGDLQQDKTFYFIAFETHRREEAGFSSIGADDFGFIPTAVPCLPNQVLLTPQQAAFFQAAIPAAGGCASPAAAPLIRTAGLYTAASATALQGNAPNGPVTFPLPIDCNLAIPGNCTAANVVPLPASFTPLTSLIGNFPTKEKTEISSVRLDHIWNDSNRSFLMAAVTPSYNTGIEVNAQNQAFGQNAGSRTSLERFLDHTGIFQHTTTISSTKLNEARFEFARRGLHYGFSNLPGGSNVAVNILGTAFFGREPFSTVDRIERRWEGADNFTWTRGRHTFKFGGEFDLLQVSSRKPQVFELNFGGVYDFGALSAASLGLNPALPAFTAVQAYGLGIPQVFFQGIGTSNVPFNTKLISSFAQDSWSLTRRLTLNYGVRYDLSLSPLFPAATTLNQAAEPAMHVVEGVPRDYKNVAPRLALAWDPRGDGKTVVRAGYGIFFDQPPLALNFNSTTADGAVSTQLEVAGGAATGVPVTAATALAALNASSIFQGVVGGIPVGGACGTNVPSNLGYLCGQQRFDPLLSGSLFTNQNFVAEGFPIPLLPFTLPTAANFVTAYAQQGSLGIEHEFGGNYTISASYNYLHGSHLYRPRSINSSNPVLLDRNYANAIESGLGPSSPLSVAVPLASPGSCISTSGKSSIQVIAPGALASGFSSANCTGAPLGFVGTAAVFNFFRPSGPNPSFGGPNAVGYKQLVALAAVAGYPTGFGVPVAWSDVEEQESSGASFFHGLTVSLNKHFSNHFQFLSSWTWSHAIDNSTDLSTLLDPQNDNFPNLERGNSVFDQRHRWVTSAILESPYRWRDKGLLKKLLAHSLVAPIIEVSSGRPYNVLTGTDFNLNFSSFTDRPSAVSAGAPGSVTSPFIPGVSFAPPTTCAAGIPAAAVAPSGQVVPVQPQGCDGNLGRNAFRMPGYFNFDLRYDRKFSLNERANFEFIADAFNLLNRFNVLAVNVLCNPLGGSCTAGQPTAAFDPRQFQFALKFNF
ncbi:MAG TPA: TonB-dependent receptor [Candidatus Acidoferrales bacterium]|nr:TonB-dependent receptor [Candidatus Acidoferrales bacterium]